MKKSKKSPQIYIGTSGWSYPHWKENFYPHEVKPNQWLSFYAQAFPTVEINSTFYHSPKPSVIENWYQSVPESFVFSIKASRYITHQKRLKDCAHSLEFLYKNIEGFKEKTGPILFQLPPYLPKKEDRLAEFLDLLRDDHQYVFEFRHETWFTDEIYKMLAKKNCALCITDLHGSLTPEEITADFTYIRLHGPKKSYEGSYGTKGLKVWKGKIEKWASEVSVYCYFDNDEKGFAVKDAKDLINSFN